MVWSQHRPISLIFQPKTLIYEIAQAPHAAASWQAPWCPRWGGVNARADGNARPPPTAVGDSLQTTQQKASVVGGGGWQR